MALPGVTIIGAGIGGLTAALSLQQRGVEVKVYEQSSKLAEVGAGLHLSPNAINVIRKLGLRPALEPYDFRPHALKTRHYQSGEPSFILPFDEDFEKEFGSPFVDIHRADLHRALSDAVLSNDPHAIALKKRLVSIVEKPGHVILEFEDGSVQQAETVLAADGVHSIIRSKLYDEPGAEFTGHVAYRGLVSTDALGSDLMEPDLNIWTGPGRHMVAYYLRRGAMLNYVAIVEDPEWKTESWTSPAEKEELVTRFEGWDPVVCRIIAQTKENECFKWALLKREPLDNWSSNRITLLGDAAHPMVPYLAQGAVMAMEDGWVFAHFAANYDNSADALQAYQGARIERTSNVQKAAWEQGQKEHKVGSDQGGEEFKGGNFASMAWLYGHDVCSLYP